MLLIVSLLQFSMTALSGDEDDPEVVDEENDLFGPWAKPNLDPDEYSYLDIISAWFSENYDEPDYLNLYLKVRDLRFEQLRAIYVMHWEYNGVEYAAGVHTHTLGTYQVFIAGVSREEYFTINGDFDLENNIVHFKVPKALIGYPAKGGTLTNTDAWNALRNKIEILTLLFGDGELIKDWAGYGRDYVIQYESLGIPYMHRIFGPSNVNPNNEMTYNFEATDPQGEAVYFYIDWGDGTVDEWVGPYSSDDPMQLSHTWTEYGPYTIRSKAKDVNGFESDWAEYGVSVIKARSYHSLLQNFLMKYPAITLIFKAFFNRALDI